MTVLAKRTLSLAVLALLSTVAIGGATDDPAAVESLTLNTMENSVEFIITSTEGVSYTYFELDGPRLVVDFHKALNRLGFLERYVGSAGVEQVRAASFSDPGRDATRVVFDLEREVPYEVVDEGGGVTRVRFGNLVGESGALRAVASETSEEPFDAMEEAEPAEVVAALGPDTGTEPSPGEGHGSDTESGTDPGARGPDMTPLPSREPLAPAPAEPNGLFIDPGVWTAETPSVGISTSNGATVEPTPIPDLTAFGSIAASGPATTPTLALARSPAELLGLSVAPSEETTVDPVEFLGQTVIPIPTPQYTGEIITLDLVGVDVRDFFRLIGDLSGLNLILDPAVAGSLTITLRDVPWDQALDVVLRNFNLGYELQGNVLRVATAATLQAEEDARTTLRAAQDLNAQLVTRTFILSYTDSATVTPIVQDLLSPRGTIIQDARRNALIISDVPSQFGRVDSLISFLDTPTQQVEIEARLLSASKSFSRSLGSQIGLLIGDDSGTGNAITGLPGPVSPFLGLPLIANFPAGGSSGLSFLLGAGGDILLDQIISTAEDRGTARLLSRPRVTTQNNQSATVSQGVQIPVQTNVNNTISTQYQDFSLSLTVLPQITEAGTILLTLSIVNSSPDFGRSVNNIPSVSTQQASTTVMIPDGGTAVIGGILLDNDSVTVSQVPGLGNIPVLGHLFKSTQVIKSTSELLFLSPPGSDRRIRWSFC